MSPWEVLGLDGPTDDLKAIKRAYAKKLRVTRPDDDPEGFMALRDALEHAKYEAQFHVGAQDNDLGNAVIDPASNANLTENHIVDVHGFTPMPEDKLIPLSHRSQDNEEAALEDEDAAGRNPAEKTDVEQVMDAVIALLADPFGRAELSRWQTLLDDPRLDGIDAAIDFEDYFRCYLLDEFGYFDGNTEKSNQARKRPLITTRIGTYIFTKMGWREKEGRPLYMQDQLDWLRRDLDVINRNKPEVQIQTQIRHADQFIEEKQDGLPWWAISGMLFGLYTIGKLIADMYGNGTF